MLLLTSKINALLNTYAAVTRKAEGGCTYNCKQGQNIVTPFLSPSDSAFTTKILWLCFCFYLHAAYCAFVGCATQKSHKFSLQLKAMEWQQCSMGAGMLPAAPLPSGKGLGEFVKKLTLRPPGHFFLHHVLVLARLLPIYAFNRRIAQESKLPLE